MSKKVIIEGYGRSGNTFLTNLLSSLIPLNEIAHHTHSFAAVKKGINYQIPTYILIRTPEEAIASSLIKGRKNLLHYLIDPYDYRILNYIDFYKRTNKIKNQIKIIEFEELVSKPEKILKMILKDLNNDISDEDITKIIDKVLESLKKDNRDIKSRQLGGKERNDLKKEVIQTLYEKPRFKECVIAYNNVLNDTI
jgi:hypothetical protein